MQTPNPTRRRVGAAFVLPLVALLWSGRVGFDAPATGAEVVAVAVTCGAAGAAWQVLHRRDLVDRLTGAAAAFAVLAVSFALAAWDSAVTSSLGTGVGLCAVLTGLVYAEQWLRGRDRRSRVRERAAREVTAA